VAGRSGDGEPPKDSGSSRLDAAEGLDTPAVGAGRQQISLRALRGRTANPVIGTTDSQTGSPYDMALDRGNRGGGNPRRTLTREVQHWVDVLG
jgi:hypothetical protein